MTRVTGAALGTIGTTLAAAPISNFDLEGDPDNNGIAGPHRFDLDPVIITTTITAGAERVEFGLYIDGISLILGDLDVPEECFNTSLVGFSASFPVEQTADRFPECGASRFRSSAHGDPRPR